MLVVNQAREYLLQVEQGYGHVARKEAGKKKEDAASWEENKNTKESTTERMHHLALQ